ncbi:MAG: hypothetical protein MJZ37_10680, partial [Bacilli bacterium]|nr:hypothetical protein [Bacilli bacterium]
MTKAGNSVEIFFDPNVRVSINLLLPFQYQLEINLPFQGLHFLFPVNRIYLQMQEFLYWLTTLQKLRVVIP